MAMAPFGRVAAAFYLLITALGATAKEAKVAAAAARGGLRPHHRAPSTHREAGRSSPPKAHAVAVKPPAPPAALVDTGASTGESQPLSELGGDVESLRGSAGQDAGGTSSSMLKSLHQELAEMKQRRVNIASLQQALSADVSLLRESAALQRLSSNQRDRVVAEQQVRQSEEIVKDTGAMLRESRLAALKDAQAVLRDQSDLQAALESLKAEAAEQLQAFESHGGERGSPDVSLEPAAHYAAPAARPVQQNSDAATLGAAAEAAADDGEDDP